jgi:hypothetical protein
MFEIETQTKAKLIDVVVLSQKNRQPDENPGAKLSIELALGNDSLAYFDGHLKSFLFCKTGSSAKPAQGSLDGVPAVSDMPNLTGIGSKIGTLHWELELTGYSLTIDLGIGGRKSNLEIEGCIVSNFRITPNEGGTVGVKCDVESPDVSEAAFGKLAKLKSREIQILLAAPEIAQQELDQDEKLPAKAKGGRSANSDATKAFIDQHAPTH